jgi:hypothetical protein
VGFVFSSPGSLLALIRLRMALRVLTGSGNGGVGRELTRQQVSAVAAPAIRKFPPSAKAMPHATGKRRQ